MNNPRPTLQVDEDDAREGRRAQPFERPRALEATSPPWRASRPAAQETMEVRRFGPPSNTSQTYFWSAPEVGAAAFAAASTSAPFIRTL
jgi:hypothetical protein